MLRELSIKNFAIIDDLRISFSDGLTILSGETGAGKSIIINAVKLLLGNRADASLIRTGSEYAELEVLFQIRPDTRVAKILNSKGYDISQGLVIQRVISRNDRHRIYLNGHISTLQFLNSITENLASISGQHAHQLLLKEEQHLIILDQFGGLMPLREKVREYFSDIMPLIQELNDLKAVKARQTARIQELEFQRQEILDASVNMGEDSALERELALLRNGETLYQAVHGCIDELYNAQNAIVERLVDVKKSLESACQIDPELSPRAKGIMDATFQIEDIAEDLRTYLQEIPLDEHRLEEVESRLDTLRRLKRKYGGSLESVTAHLESIDHELLQIENISDHILETETGIARLREQIISISGKLSEKRKKTARIFARKVEKELRFLKMDQTLFQIDIQDIPASEITDPYLKIHLENQDAAMTETGTDRATFMIAPNVGEVLKPLANIASGGELSRVVLALKAILAESESVESIIFDEVDAGIGGGVAEVVGEKLSSLSHYHQIICITHLPQIAKFGDHHFKISKHISSGRTRTFIQPLDKELRIREIARMLGGIRMTKVTLDHASEMLRVRKD